jgi:hypothetical protein
MYKREDSYKRKSTYDTSKRGKNDFQTSSNNGYTLLE